MKTEHLHELWAGPDNARLSTKQFSFRLPVHIAAKIAALCELYPTKNRTQIVADLLSSALDDLEKNLPGGCGEEVRDIDPAYIDPSIGDETPLYYLGGPRGRFRNLSNEQYEELEKELGNETPGKLYETIVGTEADFAAKK